MAHNSKSIEIRHNELVKGTGDRFCSRRQGAGPKPESQFLKLPTLAKRAVLNDILFRFCSKLVKH